MVNEIFQRTSRTNIFTVMIINYLGLYLAWSDTEFLYSNGL